MQEEANILREQVENGEFKEKTIPVILDLDFDHETGDTEILNAREKFDGRDIELSKEEKTELEEQINEQFAEQRARRENERIIWEDDIRKGN